MKKITDRKSFLLLILFALSCAKVDTLSLKSHDFSRRPSRVIWFQIAGFEEKHLAMLRFHLPLAQQSTSLETAECVGKIWNYNLYQLRPNAYEGFLAQLMGSKNIKNDCNDFSQRPIWNYLKLEGMKSGVFESGANSQQTLHRAWGCPETGGDFSLDLTFWRMAPPVEAEDETFHYQDKTIFELGKVYYDKTCRADTCHVGFFNNVKSVWQRFAGDKSKVLFIIRDFSYLNALKRKDISGAREILSEIEKAFYYFKELRGNDTLLLLTSSEVQNFEFPQEGEEWAQFEKKGNHIIFRKSDLVSTVLATGASSENFCGIYEEDEILKRVLWSPLQRKSPLDLF